MATLSLRIMRFDGTVVKEKTSQIEVKPLSSEAAVKIPLSELLNAQVDSTKLVAVAGLRGDGVPVSSNLLYFVPTKQIVLPKPHIDANVVKTAAGFDVTLKSSVLARSVYVSFEELDATYSDNYVDLLPGVEVTIHVTSEASLSALQAALQIRSLADAFKSVAAEK